MNIELIKRWLTIADLPSGVVMGIVTMTMLGLMIAAFVTHRSIDGTILTTYGLIIGPFAIHKTTTAVVSNSTTTTSEGGQ